MSINTNGGYLQIDKVGHVQIYRQIQMDYDGFIDRYGYTTITEES